MDDSPNFPPPGLEDPAPAGRGEGIVIVERHANTVARIAFFPKKKSTLCKRSNRASFGEAKRRRKMAKSAVPHLNSLSSARGRGKPGKRRNRGVIISIHCGCARLACARRAAKGPAALGGGELASPSRRRVAVGVAGGAHQRGS